MPKKAAPNGHHPDGLRLTTLSGTFEAARTVTRLTEIEKTATYAQFAARLKVIAQPRNIDTLKELFNALNLLNQKSADLGDTTLVRSSDHPLASRAQPWMGKERDA
jgi:hypothetical protein